MKSKVKIGASFANDSLILTTEGQTPEVVQVAKLKVS